MVPRVDHHEHRDDHGEEVQRQADPVDADEVRGLYDRDPVGLGDELHLAGLAVVELDHGEDAHGKRGHCRAETHRLVQRLLALRDEEHDENADERQERAD
jgi:hypothetical protein